MANDFLREMPAYRYAETHYGDDLASVCSRELGDANRWTELVWLNNLVYPYLTDNPEQVTAGVILIGSLIKVPSPVNFVNDISDEGVLYESDCLLTNKLLTVDEFGDIAVASGVKNLVQQLSHRLNTPRGQLRRHPDYGCLIWRIQGTINGPTAGALGAAYVKSTLLSDYRVVNVPSSVAVITGDVIKMTATAEVVTGGTVDITAGS